VLIDWITARILFDRLDPQLVETLRQKADRIARFSAETGELVWERSAWESVRSDSHQIAFRVGSDALWVQGSPARVIGDGCTVFGNGAARGLDLYGSLQAMIGHAAKQLQIVIPRTPELWAVSRVDVTGNLLLDSVEDVREALDILRGTNGGRYRVSSSAGSTTYWGGKSRVKKGKAYAKGPHLIFQQRQKSYTGKRYNATEIEQANRLLRLELTLGAQWFREKSECLWWEITPGALYEEWDQYFGRMVGDMRTSNDRELRQRIKAAAPTEGQAKAAYGCWALIQSNGWEKAREMQSRSTWYRNLQVLRNAGLGDADLSRGEIVQFRRRILDSRLVESWEDLLHVA
jgi:II/X family phage/plasmid replication protein